MFTDPYAKLCFTALLASQFERTIYLDLDTTFTAYFRAGLVKTENVIDIYLPSDGRLVPMINDVLASLPSSGIVIFDSVNSFYNLFRTQEKTMGSLNRLLSVILMLLVRRGVDSGVPVLATSMLRYRNAAGWVQSPASRRLLQNKSRVKLKVEMGEAEDSLVVRIVEHDSIAAESEIPCNNTAVIRA
ncbi:MAG: hypothetical protein ACREA4_01325 [Nitrososphaera sp.]